MAYPETTANTPGAQWVYLLRFFVGRTGDLACHVRDVTESQAWLVADPETARSALEAIVSTRPDATALPPRQKFERGP